METYEVRHQDSMDFSDSIDPMGIRNPNSDEKQQDSMGSDKIPIVSYRILWDSDGIPIGFDRIR